ncbi:hypothetical protein RF11_04100 [Thelohanellus kitauei]|uniref:Uncharacterized protein n=1 Tax=Thelohanellus kitauei TaxID=669202 RepID=A0A0C2IK93_THEKT|nr:hypothetical protein RF11_04100 [Thelohanellus kitauei]
MSSVIILLVLSIVFPITCIKKSELTKELVFDGLGSKLTLKYKYFHVNIYVEKPSTRFTDDNMIEMTYLEDSKILRFIFEKDSLKCYADFEMSEDQDYIYIKRILYTFEPDSPLAMKSEDRIQLEIPKTEATYKVYGAYYLTNPVEYLDKHSISTMLDDFILIVEPKSKFIYE